MATLTDFQTKFGQALQDAGTAIGTAERDAFIAQAVRTYSKDKPRTIIGAITGDGGYEYEMPEEWDEQLSVAKQVEYPAGEQVPVYLDDEDWLIYRGTEGQTLRLLSASPGTAETVLLTFSAPHVVSGGTAGTSTVPDVDQDAVIDLAAAYACYALARRYAQAVDGTIGADNVNHLNASGEYAKRGKELEQLYKSHLAPAKDGPISAASVTGDWDTTAGWQDERLTHPRRYR